MDIVNNQTGQEFARVAIDGSTTNRSVVVNRDEAQVNNAESGKQIPALENANGQKFYANNESEKAVKIVQANGNAADKNGVERNTILTAFSDSSFDKGKHRYGYSQ